MKETIEKIVNAWWECMDGDAIDKTHFENKLIELLPEYLFKWDGQRWFIASEL